MRDKDLYAQILGITPPWRVRAVDLRLKEGEVEVFLDHDPSVALVCPICGAEASGYDSRERRWRHLDTCQYRTVLVAKIPRVKCKEHDVHQISVPWSEPGSRFTALFEALAIDWLGEASLSAVSRMLNVSWDALDGIAKRAVERGLARRQKLSLHRMGVDETSFQKRHEYVTAVIDQDSGHVVHVADGNGRASLDAFYEELDSEQLEQIESVAMDMHQPYIQSTLKHVPDAEQKIAFDKFHVAKHLSDGVDMVRRQEHKELQWRGDERLKKTKYKWLKNPENMSLRVWRSFQSLRDSSLRTARAWAMKELAMSLWEYRSRTWAMKAWCRWLCWAQRCRMEPMVKVGGTVKNHLWGILNAVILKVTNARSEGLNSQIQKLKARACGYRNRDRFRRAIMFHLGGLDLYPTGVGRSEGILGYITHTNS
jgi:transposase